MQKTNPKFRISCEHQSELADELQDAIDALHHIGQRPRSELFEVLHWLRESHNLGIYLDEYVASLEIDRPPQFFAPVDPNDWRQCRDAVENYRQSVRRKATEKRALYALNRMIDNENAPNYLRRKQFATVEA